MNTITITATDDNMSVDMIEIIERRINFDDTEIQINGVKHLINGWIYESEGGSDWDLMIEDVNIYDVLGDDLAAEVVDILREQ